MVWFSFLPHLKYHFHVLPNQNSSKAFYRYWQSDFKIYVKKNRIAYTMKKNVGGPTLPTFKTYYKSYCDQDSDICERIHID